MLQEALADEERICRVGKLSNRGCNEHDNTDSKYEETLFTLCTHDLPTPGPSYFLTFSPSDISAPYTSFLTFFSRVVFLTR